DQAPLTIILTTRNAWAFLDFAQCLHPDPYLVVPRDRRLVETYRPTKLCQVDLTVTILFLAQRI
ncbi:hypothetical protein ACF1DY_38375, partial [Streptomyces albus]